MRKTTIIKATKGLAGAVALAGGSSAYGAIINVNTPADLTNTPGGGGAIPNFSTFTGTYAFWDVNGDGTNDFEFTNRYPNTAAGSYGVVWQMGMNAPTTATTSTSGVVGYQGAFVRYGSALNAGVSIGTGGAFSTAQQLVLGSQYSYGPDGIYNYGGFANSVAPGTQRYAGFRFNAADGTHYGWIQLSVNAGIIDFTNAAYESTPGVAILTGAAAAVPEPGTMAALAFGAATVAGTVIKRRRKQAAA